MNEEVRYYAGGGTPIGGLRGDVQGQSVSGSTSSSRRPTASRRPDLDRHRLGPQPDPRQPHATVDRYRATGKRTVVMRHRPDRRPLRDRRTRTTTPRSASARAGQARSPWVSAAPSTYSMQRRRRTSAPRRRSTVATRASSATRRCAWPHRTSTGSSASLGRSPSPERPRSRRGRRPRRDDQHVRVHRPERRRRAMAT